MCFQTEGTCDVQLHPNVCQLAKFEAVIYFRTPKDNIVHCFLVANVALFDSHHDTIAAFLGSLVYNWTVALNTWNITRDSEDSGRR